MSCQWQAYLELLPHWMRYEVDTQGRDGLQELRLRMGQSPELIFQNNIRRIQRNIVRDDINFVINSVSEYSPWTTSTISDGFLTAQGGHRIGICGVCTSQGSAIKHIHYPTSLCIRVARDYPNIAKRAAQLTGSILIIGPPGSGKTTLLRDLIRQCADKGQGSVVVIDEREEIFPMYRGQACFSIGEHTDVMSRCNKKFGIEAAVRNMNPKWIAVDEITAEDDCNALLHAGWCGVNLLSTAHAGSIYDLKTRPVYYSLIANKLFSHILLLHKDKTWVLERV